MSSFTSDMSLPFPALALEITTTLVKESQTAAVVDFYNIISTHVHALTKAVSFYEKEKSRAIIYHTSQFGISADATKFMSSIDPKFKMLLEVIAVLNAYALKLREFEEEFRKEWKGVKGGSVERRARFLEGKIRQLRGIKDTFEGDAKTALEEARVGRKELESIGKEGVEKEDAEKQDAEKESGEKEEEKGMDRHEA